MQSNQSDYATFRSKGRVGWAPYQCGRDMKKKRGRNDLLEGVSDIGDVPSAHSFSDVSA